jgi:hypothetical protein
MSWDDLIEMFNHGHRHLAEERDRKRIEAQLDGSEAMTILILLGSISSAGSSSCARLESTPKTSPPRNLCRNRFEAGWTQPGGLASIHR